ncbi:MAG: alpha/beta fold hydrolase [Calditrichaceae bacterium]|nr:alpha/beta fold hydrolase [Calditrichaceae bacterium]RQV97831.1 MAG: alpha/beta fold hydrolase [Calditrichota bacterium]
MHLAYKKTGNGQPLVILHGLFGMSDNWMTIGKNLADDFTVYLVDQRNHGQSPHAAEFSYPVLAEDLYDFCTQHRLNGFHLLGHSMGGKTALLYAEKYPQTVHKLIVADMALRSYDHPHFRSFLEALLSIDPDVLKSRADADARLSEKIPQLRIRQFLLKNLYRTPQNQFKWRINLQSIAQNFDHIVGGLHLKSPFPGPVLFLRGDQSDYINDHDIKEIMSVFPQAEISTIAGAGHWLHVEAPDKFLEIVRKFLAK